MSTQTLTAASITRRLREVGLAVTSRTITEGVVRTTVKGYPGVDAEEAAARSAAAVLIQDGYDVARNGARITVTLAEAEPVAVLEVVECIGAPVQLELISGEQFAVVSTTTGQRLGRIWPGFGGEGWAACPDSSHGGTIDTVDGVTVTFPNQNTAALAVWGVAAKADGIFQPADELDEAGDPDLLTLADVDGVARVQPALYPEPKRGTVAHIAWQVGYTWAEWKALGRGDRMIVTLLADGKPVTQEQATNLRKLNGTFTVVRTPAAR